MPLVILGRAPAPAPSADTEPADAGSLVGSGPPPEPAGDTLRAGCTYVDTLTGDVYVYEPD